jgi:hypothetical protein
MQKGLKPVNSVNTGSSLFTLSALLVELPFSEATHRQAQLAPLLPTFNPEQFKSTLKKRCIVEHELFHYRSLTSSTIGYFLFFLQQLLVVAKLQYLKNCPLPLLVDLAKDEDFRSKQNVVKRHPAAFAGWIDVLNFTTLWNFMNRYSAPHAGLITEFLPPFLHTDEYPPACRIPFAFLNNVAPGQELVAEVSSIPTLQELLEGWALWKEYAYLSQILRFDCPDEFRFTSEWLKDSRRRVRYRYVPDLILKAIGTNLSMALPGVLMDIATSGPIFSARKRSWLEVHPCLRLVEMLRVAGGLPRHLLKPTNTKLVTEDYYRDIEHYFNKALDWQSVESNLLEASDAIDRRVAWGQIHATAGTRDLLGAFYDARFKMGISSRRKVMSTALFPWNNPDGAARVATPPAIKFTDRLGVNLLPSETWFHSYLHLSDIALTLFLEASINPEPWSPSIFAQARDIYNLLPTIFTTQQLSSVHFLPRFEDHIGREIGHDYWELARALRPAQS